MALLCDFNEGNDLIEVPKPITKIASIVGFETLVVPHTAYKIHVSFAETFTKMIHFNRKRDGDLSVRFISINFS